MVKIGVFHLSFGGANWQGLVGDSAKNSEVVNSFIETWSKQGYACENILQTQSSERHSTFATVTVVMRKKA